MSSDNRQSEAQRKRKLDRRQRHRHMPLQIKFLRFAFHNLGPLLPQLMSRLMYYLWFKTHRNRLPVREQQWLTTARQSRMSFEQHDISLYHWGSGKTVLLVHGWNGRGLQMGSFISALLDQDCSVLAFDAPGHGTSTGQSTNAVQIARLIAQLDQKFGPFQAVIAHSLGVPASLYAALNNGLRLNCFVGISGPGDLPFLISKYTTALRIPEAVIEHFQARLIHDFGADWEQRLATARIACELGARGNTRALIIHDSDDLDVPAEQSQIIASALPGAGFVLTRGLGHRRILRSSAVIGLVAHFINGCAARNNVLD